MPVYVGFYVPATYHALYGRFFKDPDDILELEREYNDYLVRRLSAIHNLASSVNVSSVRVEAAGFQSYLASKGLDAAQLSEVETSKQVSQYSTTLRPSLFPVVERVQDLQVSSGTVAAVSTITRFTPLPKTSITKNARNRVVGISMVITSNRGSVLGRYFIWIDGDHSIKACVNVLGGLGGRIPGARVLKIEHAQPLRLCPCCRLPLAVCTSRQPTTNHFP